MKVLALFALAIYFVCASSAQNPSSQHPIPILTGAALPTYPPIWRAAHLTGKVVAAVTVKDGRVVGVNQTAGDPYLFDTTMQNIKTWVFESGTEAVFTVTFTYRMTSEETEERTNPKVEMLPSLDVNITASPVKLTVNYGSSPDC
jgi:hypothetical protein